VQRATSTPVDAALKREEQQRFSSLLMRPYARVVIDDLSTW